VRQVRSLSVDGRVSPSGGRDALALPPIARRDRLIDYLIAAKGAVHGLELATLNVKHFPMSADLAPPFRL
jgi:predicted nucleic acid-binding protein